MQMVVFQQPARVLTWKEVKKKGRMAVLKALI